MKDLLKLGITINKAAQKMIKGGGESLLITSGEGFCCEWCRDGTCNGWVENIDTPCPFANTCD